MSKNTICLYLSEEKEMEKKHILMETWMIMVDHMLEQTKRDIFTTLHQILSSFAVSERAIAIIHELFSVHHQKRTYDIDECITMLRRIHEIRYERVEKIKNLFSDPITSIYKLSKGLDDIEVWKSIELTHVCPSQYVEKYTSDLMNELLGEIEISDIEVFLTVMKQSIFKMREMAEEGEKKIYEEKSKYTFHSCS